MHQQNRIADLVLRRTRTAACVARCERPSPPGHVRRSTLDQSGVSARGCRRFRYSQQTRRGRSAESRQQIRWSSGRRSSWPRRMPDRDRDLATPHLHDACPHAHARSRPGARHQVSFADSPRPMGRHRRVVEDRVAGGQQEHARRAAALQGVLGEPVTWLRRVASPSSRGVRPA